MRPWKALLILVTLPYWITTVMAQGTSAIVGTTTDQSNAVLAGVDITVTDTSTGYERSVRTSADGTYVVESLKPGIYQVTAKKTGFAAVKNSAVVLQVAQRARVDIALKVGSTSEQVDVQGEAPTLETDTSSVGKVITTQDVENLPLNGRQFLQLATLIPGVHRTYNPPYLETTGGSVSENGMSNESNNTMVDGIMNQETGAGRMTFSPSVDMIQEFKMQTNTYDAEYGRTGGSQIEVITKRGANTYHGSAYEFIRNNALDARPYFQTGPLPGFQRNQFGATFGGHIPHSTKDFFFFSYEGLRLRQGLTAVLSLPPAAIRGGDFSGIGTTIYDPLTLDPSTGQRQPFPGNVIPTDRLNSTDLYFMNRFFPNPNPSAGVSNNYVSNPRQQNNTNQISIRYDRDFSSKDSITFRYTRNKTFLLLPRGDSGVATPLPGLGELINLYGNNHQIKWTHLFSNTTMNALTVGFSQYNQQRHPETTNKNIIPESGLQGVKDVQAGIPWYTIAGFSSLTDNFVSPISQPFDNYVLNDTFSKVLGKHSLRFGGGILYNRTQSHLNLFDRGNLNFSPTYTTASIGAPGDEYNAFAEFLLGTPTSTSIWLNPVITDWRSHTEYGFLQDDWNVSRNLSVNLGLRYDLYTRPYDTGNRESAFDLVTQKEVFPGSVPDLPGVPPGSVTAESLGYSRQLQFQTTHNNFSPRAGFAWRMLGNDKTVLRGGAGVFYNWLVIDSATNLALGPPWVPRTSISCNNDVPCTNATSPFSSIIPIGFSGNLAIKSNRTPYVVQFSLGIQRELTPTMTLEVNYVGNAAFKNLLGINKNQPVPGPGDIGPRRPYPDLGDLSGYFSIGRSHYDSLQTALRKTYSSAGLIFLASYTYSHALGDSVSGPQVNEGPSGGIRDMRYPEAEYGNTSYDIRHIFSFSSTYQLPFGNGRPLASNIGAVPNAIIGGWSVNAIVSLQTGGWITPNDIVNVSNSGNSRPDRIGNPNGFSHPSRSAEINEWFNTAAFQRAAQYTFGNAGTGIIETPGYSDVDLAVQKRFPVGERMGLQFRAEFFNAFNHTNLGAPGTSFGSPNFGTISSIVGFARDIQFGLRFDF
jgi:hypothetical protein